MKHTLFLGAALLALVMASGAGTPLSTLAAPDRFDSAALESVADFTRPDVAPLPAEGKFKVVSDSAWPGNKVRVFFLGAQYWPFCAAERWALVSALERFGTLTGYTPETHAPGLAGFRLVPTYDLRTAVYTSAYLAYSDKEIFDKDNTPLDTFDNDEQSIVDQFNPQATFPFLIINGQYAQFDSGYSPGLIDGMDFATLRSQLDAGEQNDATNAINAEADLITKYLCHSTGGEPATTCNPW
jgi:hypothetical protein